MPRLDIAPLARERIREYVIGVEKEYEGSGSDLLQQLEDAFELLQQHPQCGPEHEKASWLRTLFVKF